MSVFENGNLEKLLEPENYINKIDYKITKNMIDINKHLHNTYYMDLAKEVFPDEAVDFLYATLAISVLNTYFDSLPLFASKA